MKTDTTDTISPLYQIRKVAPIATFSNNIDKREKKKNLKKILQKY